MAVQNNKSYPMYVLNLDNTRLFWISVVFLLIFGLCFAMGLYFGKSLFGGMGRHSSKASMEESDRGVRFDTFMLNRITTETQNREFEFYQVLPKDKLTKEDIVHSIPNAAPPRSQAAEDDGFEKQPVIVAMENDDSRVKTAVEPKTKAVVVKKNQPLRKESVKIVSSYEDSRLTVTQPYTIQVASYQHQTVAENMKNRLAGKRMSSYVVRAKVNGKLYFRVRVGPFSSKAKAEETLRQVRDGMGFSAAYICSR
jgi:cell division septation protein DedD